MKNNQSNLFAGIMVLGSLIFIGCGKTSFTGFTGGKEEKRSSRNLLEPGSGSAVQSDVASGDAQQKREQPSADGLVQEQVVESKVIESAEGNIAEASDSKASPGSREDFSHVPPQPDPIQEPEADCKITSHASSAPLDQMFVTKLLAGTVDSRGLSWKAIENPGIQTGEASKILVANFAGAKAACEAIGKKVPMVDYLLWLAEENPAPKSDKVHPDGIAMAWGVSASSPAETQQHKVDLLYKSVSKKPLCGSALVICVSK